MTVGEAHRGDQNIGCNGAKAWGQPGTDAVPTYYLAQVHHYMLVPDYPHADVVAYFVAATWAFTRLTVPGVGRSSSREGARVLAVRADPHPAGVRPAAPGGAGLICVCTCTDGSTVAGDTMLGYWAQVEQDAAKTAARHETIAEGRAPHPRRNGRRRGANSAGRRAVHPQAGQARRHQVEATEYMQPAKKGKE